MMKLKKVENFEEFDDFVQNHIPTNIMQTSSWAKVKKDDWLPHYLFFEKDEKIVGSALLLARKVFKNQYLFYAPRGPILNYDNEEEVKQALKLLKKYVKDNKGFVLKFDPEITLSRKNYREQKVIEENTKYYDMLSKLSKHTGFSLKLDSTFQPRFQMVVELKGDLMAKFKSEKRRVVKPAFLEKRGFEMIEDTSEEGVREFARLSKMTEAKNNIYLRNEEYFMNFYNAFKDKKEVKLYFAQLNIEKLIEFIDDESKVGFLRKYQEEFGNIIRTNAMFCVYGTKMVQSFYAANNPDFLRYKMVYAIHLRAMQDAQDEGYEYLNLGGVEGTLNDGLSVYKGEFDPLVFEYIGEFDLIINPFIYHSFNLGLKVMKKIRNK